MRTFLSVKHILKDLPAFIEDKHFEAVDKLYACVPNLKCNNCGTCCYDSPDATYPEYLYALVHILKKVEFDGGFLDLLKDSLRYYFLSILAERLCVFRVNDKCSIYEAAPFSCKLFGVLPRDIHDFNVANARKNSLEFQIFYREKGIDISDERTNFETPYCGSVKVVDPIKSGYMEGLTTEYIKVMFNIQNDYLNFSSHRYAISSWMAFMFFGEKQLYFDRFKVIKDLQNGNSNAVEDYIDNLDYHAAKANFDVLKSIVCKV